MTTIQLDVSDEVVARYGQKALVERLERLLAWEDLQQKAIGLKAFLDANGLDHDAIAEEARSRAWIMYKNTVLKDVLPDE